MTIDKSQTIKIPIWLVSVALPLLVAAIVAYGSITGFKAETRTEINQLKESQSQKVDQKQFDLIIKSLDKLSNSQEKMNDKLDKHIEKHNDK